MLTSDGPKQISAEVSAEVSAEISAETEISVIRTEISVCKHYKEMNFHKYCRKLCFPQTLNEVPVSQQFY